MSGKYMCDNYKCIWHGYMDAVLIAPHPFSEGEEILGCPSCKEINQIFEACAEDGCWKAATCGTPTPEGYKRTCGPHMPRAA